MKIKRDVFHGLGVERWNSHEAKELFARSFINISEKCLLAPLIPLLTIGLDHDAYQSIGFYIQLGVAAYLGYLGLFLRHEALQILDYIHSGKNEKAE